MAKTSTIYPTIKEKDSGEIVVQLQLFLSRCGSNVKVDGQFNVGTRNAVRAFQKKQGLEVTGVVDSKTWLKLLEKAGNINWVIDE